MVPKRIIFSTMYHRWPKANAQFWDTKIERNKERDLDTNKKLRRGSWKVNRVWEHQDMHKAANRILKPLDTRAASEPHASTE